MLYLAMGHAVFNFNEDRSFVGNLSLKN